MNIQDIKNNVTFNEKGILEIDENIIKAIYNELNINFNGLQNHSVKDMEIISDLTGINIVVYFKTEKAKKTKTGLVKKSEYQNPNCYSMEAQQIESWFKARN